MAARSGLLLTLCAALALTLAGSACTSERSSDPVSIRWNAAPPRLVSDWAREAPFTYNRDSDVDRHGRFVVFASNVKDGALGVFLRDMRSRSTVRLDVWYTGKQPAPGTAADQRIHKFGSGTPSISANGRYVAFVSGSPYLVPGDENRALDIVVYERRTSRLRLVSANAEGIQADGPSSFPSISATGRFIAFSSSAGNLATGRTHREEVYVKDMKTGAIQLVSRGSGSDRLDGTAGAASISDDGRRVAFISDADDLVPGDRNRARDAFVGDVSTGEITRVSVTTDGAELVPFVYEESAGVYRDGVDEMALSGDGRTVAISTHANGLVPEDQNRNVDIYVHDLESHFTERVSVTSNGDDAYRKNDRACGDNGECFGFIRSHSPTVSRDGRYVAFLSGAPRLEPRDVEPADAREDVFVHDRKTGLTVLVNRTFSGKPGNGYNFYAGSISGDGKWISFATDGGLLRKRHGRGQNGDVYLQRLPVPFHRSGE